MSSAFIYHDLTNARQGALSGHRELQQLSCQGMDALLVHVGSFQMRRFDEDQLIERDATCLTAELSDSTNCVVPK